MIPVNPEAVATHIDDALDAAANRAFGELQKKTIQMVQEQTAFTWGGRALASLALYSQTGDMQHFLDAQEYGHEAVEHAALAGIPGFSDAIAQRIEHAKRDALHPHGGA